MLALIEYVRPIIFHQSRNLDFSGPMPLPTIATNRPPGANNFNAFSMCFEPMNVLLVSVVALLETGLPSANAGVFYPVSFRRSHFALRNRLAGVKLPLSST
jgi:hypothetical protein